MDNTLIPLKHGNTASFCYNVWIAEQLDKRFDYALEDRDTPVTGTFVTAPIGSRMAVGIIAGSGSGDIPKARLKPIAQLHTHLPPMKQELRDFLTWVAWYTMTPVGTVLKMAIPVKDALEAPKKREKQLYQALPEIVLTHKSMLSPAQKDAADRLNALLTKGYNVTLLDGVTGSGKTEVYFEVMEAILRAESGQILILLPEIALSIQWLERFEQRFGFTPVTWHSNITPARRREAWRAIVHGRARVVVGARSALFLPFKDLHAIVVDEEHEPSYKQEEGVIYHARDMAVARGQFASIPVILASATPSAETLHNVSIGKYQRVKLTMRHGGASMPSTTLIDMRSAALEKGAFISSPLREQLAETLRKGLQSLLFLNRRGYAPLTLCRACGHRYHCVQCTAWLVWHEGKQRLMCHHCGYNEPLPTSCISCGAEATLYPIGPGVERIAEEVRQCLPEARMAVLASDTGEQIELLHTQIEAMQRGEIDILIGTQMVAKGHHFGRLALVGVVDADLGLGGGDPRAAERTYQLLQQLSGRAGREAVAGDVYIQSFQPNHPVMQALTSGNRDQFMTLELNARKSGNLPPYARLAALIIEGVHEKMVSNVARDLARSAPSSERCRVFGPAPAPLYQLRGKYRQRLLIQADKKLNIQHYITELLKVFPVSRQIRIKIDIDPQSFL